MAKQKLPMMFPAGGIDRSRAYAASDPQTAYDTLNVLPQDTILGRVRGGSRQGMDKHYASVLLTTGGGSPTIYPIRCLGQLTKTNGTPILFASGGGLFVYETSPGTWTGGSATLFGSTARICHCVAGDVAYFAASGSTNPYYFDAGTAASGTHGNPPADPLGTVPLNCSIVAMIGDRLTFAGDSSAPRAYYMSRPGSYNDYAYGETDDDRAITGSVAVGGINRDGIKAIIPWLSDYSIWCCQSSMMLLVGDNPVTGAYFLPISNRFGSLDSMSWCYGPDRSVFIMTRDGIVMCDAGNPRGEPKLISQDKMPREMLAIDPATYEVVMGWDSRAQLLHIFISKTSATSGIDHWAYSLKTGGFFRMRYATANEPLSVCAYTPLTSTGTNLLLGCRDSYLRKFSNTTATDDGTNFDSHVMMGPFRPSGDDQQDGKILELYGTIAASSGSVTCAILPAATAESAVAASSFWSTTLAAGRSDSHRPRVRCGDAIVKVSGTAGTAWAMEKIELVTAPGGRQR